MLVEGLLEPLGLHDVGVHRRAMAEGPDALGHALLIDVHNQVEAQVGHHFRSKINHLRELPGGVHVHQREGGLRGIKGLHRQMQHHGGILADRIQHHRLGECCGNLAENMDRFGFKTLKVVHGDGALEAASRILSEA